uniref:Uncharacterized protein n=1 Tax=Triticum urartu TaxID=4572 RepID=A0A8R7PQA9_TRIUA
MRSKDTRSITHNRKLAPTHTLLRLDAHTIHLSSGDLDLDGLRLLGLGRRQLLDRHGEHAVAARGGDLLHVGVLRQHELAHQLAHAALHPQVPSVLLLLPPPLAADHQHPLVLHLHLDVAGPQPRHVHHERVRARQLLHVGGGGRHGARVPDVGARRALLLAGGIAGSAGLAVRDVQQVLQRRHQRGLQPEHPALHCRSLIVIDLLGVGLVVEFLWDA